MNLGKIRQKVFGLGDENSRCLVGSKVIFASLWEVYDVNELYWEGVRKDRKFFEILSINKFFTLTISGIFSNGKLP